MRPALPIEPRRVSPGTRAKILAATDHVCARPDCPDKATDVDHILPLWLGGSNREKNLEGLCPAHHSAKTKAEASLRAKAKRRQARAEGTRRQRQPIPQRANPWPKGRKLPTKKDRITFPSDCGQCPELVSPPDAAPVLRHRVGEDVMTDFESITAASAAFIPGELVARAVEAEQRALMFSDRADQKAFWLCRNGTVRDGSADALASLARDVAFLLKATSASSPNTNKKATS